ncbi:MAG: DUF1569 domain-containing protein [Gemmatimonadota bacterium]
MATVFDPATQDKFLDRMDNLRADMPGLWGRMNAPQMVCHLTDAISIAMGEITAPPRPGLLSTRFVRWLIISVIPIPRGKAQTSPVFLTTKPGDWASDVARLKTKFRGLAARRHDPATTWPPHPRFGQLSPKQIGMLMAKHVDHHLRQFGV